MVDQIPVPSYDVRAAVNERRDGFQLAALRAVAADDALARRVGVDPADRARLADEAFIDAVLRDEEAANKEYAKILNRNKTLERWMVDVRNDTMGPFIGPIPAAGQ